MHEHPPPEPDPDETDAGYRDSLEENAYEQAQPGWDDPDEDQDEDVDSGG
jgi:hypothetical protein